MYIYIYIYIYMYIYIYTYIYICIISPGPTICVTAPVVRAGPRVQCVAWLEDAGAPK